jgi:hypothetical protein
MQLSELLGLCVRDAGSHRIGTVIDVRLSVNDSPDGQPLEPQILGVLVSPRSRTSYLGYERSAAVRPRLLAALLRWRHRGTFLAGWDDIAAIETSTVRLRSGYTRYSPILRDTSRD